MKRRSEQFFSLSSHLNSLLAVSAFIVLVAFTSCDSSTNAHNNPPENVQFRLCPPGETGITFSNDVDDLGEYSPFSTYYIYNGGGVSVADIDQDGLQDLFFTGNQVPNKLYLNLGNMKFKDITIESGISDGGGWTTGSVFADINGDGYPDLYVCKSGFDKDGLRTNQLFINQKDGTFIESAEALGLADSGPSSHAIFFDFDRDNDLDCYVVNHPDDFSRAYDFYYYLRDNKDSLVSDRLYVNENGKFHYSPDINGLSMEHGFGLSVSVGDVNQDGWPDLFVANDFFAPDYLFINNQDGTFSDQRDQYFEMVSLFSMGSDFSDLNNDGKLDLIVADMEPETHFRRKNNDFRFSIDLYNNLEKAFNARQYSRNMLHLSMEDGSFSEIGRYAGIAYTDWSWSVLSADYDNDGKKDLFITNGTKREFHDVDYVMLKFDGDMLAPKHQHAAKELIDSMPKVLLNNYIFQNQGEAKFENKTVDWGLDQPAASQGAAYADLNNDGYLDLIINNTDAEPLIYENTGSRTTENHYLRIKLEGITGNTNGLGAKVTLYTGTEIQFQELQTVRGFQSSVEPIAHFGLGSLSDVDSLIVEWLDGSVSKVTSPKVDQTLILKQSTSSKIAKSIDSKPALFTSIPFPAEPFIHQENFFNDFKRDKIIPHRLSREGPALAIADVNQDGLDDFFVGSSANHSSKLFIQQRNGTFNSSQDNTWLEVAEYEDISAIFFDANGDSFPDLYVATGGNEFDMGSNLLLDRFYLNDGKGKLNFINTALPEIKRNTKNVAAADLDNDGDLDLFVGGGWESGNYGESPLSSILINTNGIFKDATQEIAPDISRIGMTTDSKWCDIDQDGDPDLVIAGEWMGITVYFNENGKLSSKDDELAGKSGWWRHVGLIDLQKDGYPDILGGNYGENGGLQPTQDKPISLLLNDFDQNGSVDPILFQYLGDVNSTVIDRDLFCLKMPGFQQQYLTYRSFAEATYDNVLPKDLVSSAIKKSATTFKSSISLNTQDGSFAIKELPKVCQRFPICTSLTYDFNGDGLEDILVAGNSDSEMYQDGPQSSGRGVILLQNPEGELEVMTLQPTGLNLRGDVKNIGSLKIGGILHLIVVRSNGPLDIYKLNQFSSGDI